jgi:DNA polymerase-3 subunit epsilon
MELNLKKDLAFFDLETTGVDISKDRIVQIGIVKYFADGTAPQEKCRLINPEIPIPKESSEIHGITDDDVKDKPTFKQLAKGIYNFIGDADLCGYNSTRFDIPFLIEEFERAGLSFDVSDRNIIDAFRIFQKMEPRTLKGAYKFYCGKDLKGAHDALEDIKATIEVLKGQIAKYEGVDYEEDDGSVVSAPVKNDMKALHEFSNDKNKVDLTGKLVRNGDGKVVFNFGKHKGKPVIDVINEDESYYRWAMFKSDFSSETKNKLQLIKSGELK